MFTELYYIATTWFKTFSPLSAILNWWDVGKPSVGGERRKLEESAGHETTDRHSLSLVRSPHVAFQMLLSHETTESQSFHSGMFSCDFSDSSYL